jgi:uncharacterized cupin superfamily protein
LTPAEAKLIETPAGLVPADCGWYIVNLADAAGRRSDDFGKAARLEGEGEARFPQFAMNVRVLEPGEPNCLYHRENLQEAFLVLGGECIAIVEEEERPMRKGDFLYAPPGTNHVFVGAGDGPCTILMVGSRSIPEEVVYPVSEAAARHGASVTEETDDPAIAYEGSPPSGPARLPFLW